MIEFVSGMVAMIIVVGLLYGVFILGKRSNKSPYTELKTLTIPEEQQKKEFEIEQFRKDFNAMMQYSASQALKREGEKA